MPVRRIDAKVPACRARMDLLKEVEKYIRDRSADEAAGAGEGYGKTFSVIAQDSLGTTEVLSVEDLKVPLAPTTHRLQMEGGAHDAGGELLRITITFANDPAMADCHMRLVRPTAEAAETGLNGMWQYLRGRISAYQHASVFVRRFGAGVLAVMLVFGVVSACGSAALFYLQMLTLGSVAAAISLLVLSYAFLSWRTPHCALDTMGNEGTLDLNKWYAGILISSVVLPLALRLFLKLGFGL